MNERHRQILFLLHDNNSWMTAKELAEKLSVSDRTIRSDVAKINQAHTSAIIVSDRHKGYSLIDARIIQEISSEPSSKNNNIPQTPEDRIAFILKKLLLDDQAINIYCLLDEMYVSEFSIENDLRKVRQKLADYPGLELVRSKNHIQLNGVESEKRQLYKVLLKEETKGSFLSMDKLASLFSNIDLLKIKELLDETLAEYDFHIREMLMPMLMIHIGISIERLLKCNYIQTNIKREEVENTLEFEIARSFFDKVSRIIRIQVVESEVLRFTLLLMGKRNNRFQSKEIALKSSRLSILEIVDKILQKIYEKFNVDLRYDNELKIGLCIHLQGMDDRHRQNIEIENIYLQEIKQNYKLVFEMAIWAVNVLHQYVDYEINEDETGFIALHLGSAYERSSLNDKYRAVMICPEEQVLSKMCYQKIYNRFNEKMNIAALIGVFDERKVLEYDPDLIISTLPIQHNLKVPTIQISTFLNYADESKIFYTLYDLDQMKNKENFESFIKDMVHPKFFYTDLDLENAEDVIHYMCDEIIKSKWVPAQFKESVFEREKLASTSIVNGVALPHALNSMAMRSCISIAFMKRPIRWGKFDVSMVILLAIKEDDSKLMGIFFDWLTNVISDASRFERLLEVKEYPAFIQLFETQS